MLIWLIDADYKLITLIDADLSGFILMIVV